LAIRQAELRSTPGPVVEAGVHSPGRMRRHADRVLPVHELIVVQSGTLPITEEERRFAVHGDHWVLLRAGRRHYGHDDISPDSWFYWICFGTAPLEADGIESAVLGGPSTGMVARPDRIRTLFENVLEDQEGGILVPATANGYLQLILAEVRLEPAAGTNPSKAFDLARQAYTFVADHLTEPDLRMAHVADALGFNADYVGRTFRKVFNRTLTRHIHRLRIDRARMLFRSTDFSIARVASEVGFSDERYFRRVFKRMVGLTPGQFQRLAPSGPTRIRPTAD
jgi:AraC-like DNA-binding protein